MPDALPVHVNRDGLHSLEVPVSFETTGSFDVRLINHGEPIHVHLHLDDGLSEVGRLDAGNHYVQGNDERVVGVEVADGVTGMGKLKVVTSYGAETRYVDVDLVEPDDEDQEVEVDESLAEPRQRETGRKGGATFDRELPVLVLGGVALLFAAAVGLLVPTTAVRIGAAVVILTVVVALYLVLQ